MTQTTTYVKSLRLRKMKNIFKNLNKPFDKNSYLVSIVIVFSFLFFVAKVFELFVFKVPSLLLGIVFMFIFVRKRLIDIGWSTWWTIICISQLLVFIPANELGPTGELLLYLVLPGFLILLYFTNSKQIAKKREV